MNGWMQGWARELGQGNNKARQVVASYKIKQG
jgi:hypothetical protein